MKSIDGKFYRTDLADTSYKIIKRYYDCGAGDSDSPNYEFFKMKLLTRHFSYTQKVDTTTLDNLEWLKNENK